MEYLYDTCDQISDFYHQQLLRKISWTDRGKTVYPPPPLGSGGIKRANSTTKHSKYNNKTMIVNNYINFKKTNDFSP
jgi:hypothetical protein